MSTKTSPKVPKFTDINGRAYTNPLMMQFMTGDTSICSSISSAFSVEKEVDPQELRVRSRARLRSGGSMPRFGLGTWLSGATYSDGTVAKKEGDNEATKACLHALKTGYPMIDTAQMYQNEVEVGEALSQSGLERKNVFVVTKLAGNSHGAVACEAALKKSLELLKIKYVDLFLIHSPQPGKIVETWRAMLKLRTAGLAKSVGVSNFGAAQLEGLRLTGLEMPEVNQIEFHPWLHQKKCAAYMDKHGIVKMGYCPLARCKQFGKTKLAELASAKGKSEAQISIRWSLQKGFVTIPKSSKPARISANADVFSWTLSDKDMSLIDTLNVGFKASNSVNSMDIPWKDVA